MKNDEYSFNQEKLEDLEPGDRVGVYTEGETLHENYLLRKTKTYSGEDEPQRYILTLLNEHPERWEADEVRDIAGNWNDLNMTEQPSHVRIPYDRNPSLGSPKQVRVKETHDGRYLGSSMSQAARLFSAGEEKYHKS